MPAPKKKEYVVIPNPELLLVGRAFVPSFGSDEDLSIVDRVGRYEKLLRTVDNKILRGDPTKHTSTMKRILYEEKNIIAAITRRNNDF